MTNDSKPSRILDGIATTLADLSLASSILGVGLVIVSPPDSPERFWLMLLWGVAAVGTWILAVIAWILTKDPTTTNAHPKIKRTGALIPILYLLFRSPLGCS